MIRTIEEIMKNPYLTASQKQSLIQSVHQAEIERDIAEKKADYMRAESARYQQQVADLNAQRMMAEAELKNRMQQDLTGIHPWASTTSSQGSLSLSAMKKMLEPMIKPEEMEHMFKQEYPAWEEAPKKPKPDPYLKRMLKDRLSSTAGGRRK